MDIERVSLALSILDKDIRYIGRNLAGKIYNNQVI